MYGGVEIGSTGNGELVQCAGHATGSGLICDVMANESLIGGKPPGGAA